MRSAIKHKSTVRAWLSAAVMLLIVMTTIVQHHHHCSCHNLCTPTHEHHCALHIDAADQLRHDFDINDSPTLHIDLATTVAQVEVSPTVVESHYTYYVYPLLTHFTQWCADATRRGPPSAVDFIS